MDHDGHFMMEDSIMSQELNVCDNFAVSSANLNEFAQTQSKHGSKNEIVEQQVSSKAPFYNYEKYVQDPLYENICTTQLEGDSDEVMKEVEDNSEESILFRCQSPETLMTDSSYSESGSLLETPYALSPGTSPEPHSPFSLSERLNKQGQSSALELASGDTLSSVPPLSSSEQYISSSENVLDHHLTCIIGTSPVAEEKPPYSGTGDQETSKQTCPITISANQDPSQLLERLDQLSKSGDDTRLPLYLHEIAEAFVSHEDYQRAICCIQLERLYHQRLLDNLTALQKQWESHCNTTDPALTSSHLDTLQQICLTHSRPKTIGVECPLDSLAVPSCSTDCLIEGKMEQLQISSESSLLVHTIDLGDTIDSSVVPGNVLEDGNSKNKDCSQHTPLNESECIEEPAGGPEGTMLAPGVELPPSRVDDMDQSKTAEQQGEGLSPAQEQEADAVEQQDVEEATEALEMEDDEEGEEEGQNGKAFRFCPKTLPVETVVSAAAVEIRLQESKSEPEITLLSPEETQISGESCLGSDMQAFEENDLNRPCLDFGKEEEEDDYEVEQVDLVRAAATLDDLAKQITVEELIPAPGLVSILKKKAVLIASPTSAGPQSLCDKLPAKRRVRFKVPDDCFDNEMGGGDSCLLLFLLCLVTVVISIGGTALYCALGDTHSSVCQDFSRNADFYFGQIQRGISQIQHWFSPSA
ncbi:unnamed protein product [Knipowitschia caucasica]